MPVRSHRLWNAQDSVFVCRIEGTEIVTNGTGKHYGIRPKIGTLSGLKTFCILLLEITMEKFWKAQYSIEFAENTVYPRIKDPTQYWFGTEFFHDKIQKPQIRFVHAKHFISSWFCE